MALVPNPNDIRLAMVGMVPDNAHPYSWSAIINGFDPDAMSRCPAPIIYEYLRAQPPENIGIPGVRVTHVWCEDPTDAKKLALAARVPNVVGRPTDVIGLVDAVCIPTDIGSEHLERARPFVEAGVPAFIDKPLTDRADHLAQFAAWMRAGKPIMSTSACRYAREFVDARTDLYKLGELRLITATMVKNWARYGIHALEGVYPFLAPGQWLSVANTGVEGREILHVRHASGVDVVLALVDDLYGGFGCVEIYGTVGRRSAQFVDRFHAFKAQLQAFVRYLREGTPVVPLEQTIELMKIIIAGLRSRALEGRTVQLSEIDLS
jgi:predicted dehydrogenase